MSLLLFKSCDCTLWSTSTLSTELWRSAEGDSPPVGQPFPGASLLNTSRHPGDSVPAVKVVPPTIPPPGWWMLSGWAWRLSRSGLNDKPSEGPLRPFSGFNPLRLPRPLRPLRAGRRGGSGPEATEAAASAALCSADEYRPYCANWNRKYICMLSIIIKHTVSRFILEQYVRSTKS